jgi:PAS domain-containing protein
VPQELESARKLGTLIDIEWRKMAEEALRENEALLKDVLDSLSAHIAVLDERGTITAVNAAWRHFAETMAAARPVCRGWTTWRSAGGPRSMRKTRRPGATLEGCPGAERQGEFLQSQVPVRSPPSRAGSRCGCSR